MFGDKRGFHKVAEQTTQGDGVKTAFHVDGKDNKTPAVEEPLIFTGNARFSPMQSGNLKKLQLIEWVEERLDEKEFVDILVHDVEAANKFARLLAAVVRDRPELVQTWGLGSGESRLHLILRIDREGQHALHPILKQLDVTMLYHDSIMTYDLEVIQEIVMEDLNWRAEHDGRQLARKDVVIEHLVGSRDAMARYHYGGQFDLEALGFNVKILELIHDVPATDHYDFRNIIELFFAYDDEQGRAA